MKHHSRLRLMALPLLGLGASQFGACSDSGFSSANQSGGATSMVAGQGGEETTPGGSSVGGSAVGGSNTAGSVSAESGQAGEVNESGAAGMPSSTGSTCMACAVMASSTVGAKSCAALQACVDSPSCSAWSTCVRSCNDAACTAACDAQHPEVARYSADVYACLCQSCSEACAPLGVCDRACDHSKDLEVQASAPLTLAETHLYSDAVEVAGHAHAYQPQFPLWSDAARKERFVYLPACSKVDTTDMDHWDFPVGTRLWKHFYVTGNNQGPDTVPLETRFIHRFGPGADDWIFAAYQWPAGADAGTIPNPSDAKLVPNGVVNANNTTHDIPSLPQCKNCHTKLKERVLSFSAIQLSHALSGETITSISDNGWLTAPARQGFDPPGDLVAQTALGYLHANCGNCHNSSFSPVEPPPLLRLLVSQTTVPTTDTYKSLVNVPTVNVDFKDLDRIEPGNAAKSEIVVRMQRRPPQTGQMPPLGTKIVHPEGVAAVSAWINALTGMN